MCLIGNLRVTSEKENLIFKTNLFHAEFNCHAVTAGRKIDGVGAAVGGQDTAVVRLLHVGGRKELDADLI